MQRNMYFPSQFLTTGFTQHSLSVPYTTASVRRDVSDIQTGRHTDGQTDRQTHRQRDYGQYGSDAAVLMQPSYDDREFYKEMVQCHTTRSYLSQSVRQPVGQTDKQTGEFHPSSVKSRYGGGHASYHSCHCCRTLKCLNVCLSVCILGYHSVSRITQTDGKHRNP